MYWIFAKYNTKKILKLEILKNKKLLLQDAEHWTLNAKNGIEECIINNIFEESNHLF